MDIDSAKSATLVCTVLAVLTVTTIGIMLDALFSTGMTA